MSRASDMFRQLEELETIGQGDSPIAVHLRDQLRESMSRAFMKTIAPSFVRPDGSYPEWISGSRTKLGPPWVVEEER